MLLLTGAGGFLGKFLSSRLVETHVPFKASFRSTPLRSRRLAATEYCFADLSEPDTLREAVRGTSGIIHLACTLSTDFATVMNVDVKGTHTLLEAWESGVFVYASSMDVYPLHKSSPLRECDKTCPTTYYGLGKLINELDLDIKSKNDGPRDVIVFRIPRVIGAYPGFEESVFGKIIKQAIKGDDFVLPDARFGTSWIDADELVHVMVDAFMHPRSGLYNISGGWIYWREAIEIITSRVSSESKILNLGRGEAGDIVKGRELCCDKISEVYGYTPQVTFRDCICKIIDYMDIVP